MLILSMRAEPEMILALFAFYALGAGGIDIEPPSGELRGMILSNINFARYQEIPESRLQLLLFFSHPTVVISGDDERVENHLFFDFWGAPSYFSSALIILLGEIIRREFFCRLGCAK